LLDDVDGHHIPGPLAGPNPVPEPITADEPGYGESAAPEEEFEEAAVVEEPVSPILDKPKGNASKQEWLDYAERRGMDEDERNTYTRDELAEHFKDD
jgi:hypothetical protein